MTTIKNDKTNEAITTTLSNSEAAAKFAELFADKDSWLWFHLHKAVQNAPTKESMHAFTFLNDLFVVAIGYGLKRPMIRVHYKDQRFKFYLSQKGTLCIKSGMLVTHETSPGCEPVYTHDPVGDEFYVGCLLDSKFLPAQDGRYGDQNRRTRELTRTESEFFERLNADPIGFLAECSKDMNRCCYCNLPLEDARSKAVGYGATCAKRWGLPWGKDTDVEKAPSFAREYDHDVRGLCRAIRAEPENDLHWAVLGDWQESHGLPRCEKPKKGVTMPRGGKKPVVPAPAANKVEAPKPANVLPVVETRNVVNMTPATYSSDLFTFCKDSKRMFGFASDLGDIINDTIIVRSTKTCNMQTFKLIRAERNADEIIAWHYAPTSECGMTTLVVHND